MWGKSLTALESPETMMQNSHLVEGMHIKEIPGKEEKKEAAYMFRCFYRVK